MRPQKTELQPVFDLKDSQIEVIFGSIGFFNDEYQNTKWDDITYTEYKSGKNKDKITKKVDINKRVQVEFNPAFKTDTKTNNYLRIKINPFQYAQNHGIKAILDRFYFPQIRVGMTYSLNQAIGKKDKQIKAAKDAQRDFGWISSTYYGIFQKDTIGGDLNLTEADTDYYIAVDRYFSKIYEVCKTIIMNDLVKKVTWGPAPDKLSIFGSYKSAKTNKDVYQVKFCIDKNSGFTEKGEVFAIKTFDEEKFNKYNNEVLKPHGKMISQDDFVTKVQSQKKAEEIQKLPCGDKYTNADQWMLFHNTAIFGKQNVPAAPMISQQSLLVMFTEKYPQNIYTVTIEPQMTVNLKNVTVDEVTKKVLNFKFRNTLKCLFNIDPYKGESDDPKEGYFEMGDDDAVGTTTVVQNGASTDQQMSATMALVAYLWNDQKEFEQRKENQQAGKKQESNWNGDQYGVLHNPIYAKMAGWSFGGTILFGAISTTSSNILFESSSDSCDSPYMDLSNPMGQTQQGNITSNNNTDNYTHDIMMQSSQTSQNISDTISVISTSNITTTSSSLYEFNQAVKTNNYITIVTQTLKLIYGFKHQYEKQPQIYKAVNHDQYIHWCQHLLKQQDMIKLSENIIDMLKYFLKKTKPQKNYVYTKIGAPQRLRRQQQIVHYFCPRCDAYLFQKRTCQSCGYVDKYDTMTSNTKQENQHTKIQKFIHYIDGTSVDIPNYVINYLNMCIIRKGFYQRDTWEGKRTVKVMFPIKAQCKEKRREDLRGDNQGLLFLVNNGCQYEIDFPYMSIAEFSDMLTSYRDECNTWKSCSYKPSEKPLLQTLYRLVFLDDMFPKFSPQDIKIITDVYLKFDVKQKESGRKYRFVIQEVIYQMIMVYDDLFKSYKRLLDLKIININSDIIKILHEIKCEV